VFRGTDDMQDAAIDVSAVPSPSSGTEFGIGVHSGMYAALQQDGQHVNVLEEVLKELNKHRQWHEHLILSGHSLGGGYAQIVALHLLHREAHDSYHSAGLLKSTAGFGNIQVHTFGAPHVVVPPPSPWAVAEFALWRELESRSTLWVNSWDPVPRLPMCADWLKLSVEAYIFKVCLRPEIVDTRVSMLSKYDVTGNVVMVSKTPNGACQARSKDACLQITQKELLSEVPPEVLRTAGRLRAYHSMAEYLSIAEGLLPVS